MPLSCKFQKDVWYEICIINIHKTRLNSWRIWHNDICLLLHVNVFSHIWFQSTWRGFQKTNEMVMKWMRWCSWILFIAFFLLLLVYLNFIWKFCTWVCAECFHPWDEFFKWNLMWNAERKQWWASITNSYGFKAICFLNNILQKLNFLPATFCFHTSIQFLLKSLFVQRAFWKWKLFGWRA